MARGGEVQRGWEWDQRVVGVPRVAVEQQEVACGPPRRRRRRFAPAVRGSREGEVEDEGMTFLQFLKSSGILL